MSRFNKVVKRIFDFICSTLGLIALSPVLLAIVIKIKTGSDGPVFFKQIRVGEKNKMGQNGKDYVLANHTYHGLAEKFLNALK